jgi:hypothetical protein
MVAARVAAVAAAVVVVVVIGLGDRFGGRFW